MRPLLFLSQFPLGRYLKNLQLRKKCFKGFEHKGVQPSTELPVSRVEVKLSVSDLHPAKVVKKRHRLAITCHAPASGFILLKSLPGTLRGQI